MTAKVEESLSVRAATIEMNANVNTSTSRKQQQQQQQVKDTEEQGQTPTGLSVLLGRQRNGWKRSPGIYRSLLEGNADEYYKQRASAKRSFAWERIIEPIQNRGGIFYELSEGEKWVVLHDSKKLLNIVMQALRDCRKKSAAAAVAPKRSSPNTMKLQPQSKKSRQSKAKTKTATATKTKTTRKKPTNSKNAVHHDLHHDVDNDIIMEVTVATRLSTSTDKDTATDAAAIASHNDTNDHTPTTLAASIVKDDHQDNESVSIKRNHHHKNQHDDTHIIMMELSTAAAAAATPPLKKNEAHPSTNSSFVSAHQDTMTSRSTAPPTISDQHVPKDYPVQKEPNRLDDLCMAIVTTDDGSDSLETANTSQPFHQQPIQSKPQPTPIARQASGDQVPFSAQNQQHGGVCDGDRDGDDESSSSTDMSVNDEISLSEKWSHHEYIRVKSPIHQKDKPTQPKHQQQRHKDRRQQHQHQHQKRRPSSELRGKQWPQLSTMATHIPRQVCQVPRAETPAPTAARLQQQQQQLPPPHLQPPCNQNSASALSDLLTQNNNADNKRDILVLELFVRLQRLEVVIDSVQKENEGLRRIVNGQQRQQQQRQQQQQAQQQTGNDVSKGS